MPFILRAVKLVGVDSVMLPSKDRIPAWERLVKDLPGDVLEKITSRVIPLSEALQTAEDMLAGNLQGRVLISVN